MKNALYLKGLRLWVQGLLLLALRWAQLKNGFDPETGLSRQSVPGIVLAAAILLLAAAEAAFCFRLPGGSRSYPCCFRPTEGPDLPLLAAGSLLLGGGGALLAVAELRNAEPGVLAIATAAAGIAAAAGILLFVRHGGGVEARHLAGAVAYLIVGKGYERKTRIVHFVEHEIRRLVLVGRTRDKPPEQRQVGIGGRGRIARRRADKHQSGSLVGFDAVMPRRVCLHHAEAVRHRHPGQRSARTVPDNAADYRSACGYRRQCRRNN